MAQVALAWLLANPAIAAPILGASNPQQLEDNVTAAELTLGRTDLEKLDKLSPLKSPYIT